MLRALLLTAVAAAALVMLAPSPEGGSMRPATGDGPADSPPRAGMPGPGEPAGNGIGELVLDRAGDGHFYLDAQVGPATVRFLVDTGASTVALTREDAQRAGVQFAAGDFTATGYGAGGEIALKPVVLDRIAAGPLQATQVDAVVLAGDSHVSLLGQSWLRRVGSVRIEGDRMVLR